MSTQVQQKMKVLNLYFKYVKSVTMTRKLVYIHRRLVELIRMLFVQRVLVSMKLFHEIAPVVKSEDMPMYWDCGPAKIVLLVDTAMKSVK
jgi:hypothetical protein